MRRPTAVRAALLAAVTTALTLVAAVPAVADPTTTPTAGAPTATADPTGTPASPSASPTASTPATKGVPATFTGRLEQLQDQATTLQTDVTAKSTAAAAAIAAYTTTTEQVQQQIATAAAAETQLQSVTAKLDAARTQVQVLARDTYVERVPRAGTAMLLTSNVTDVDFTVAALGYLADRGASVYADFRALKATASTFAAAQQDALTSARALQVTADAQRAAALTALGEAQTQRATFVAAVATLRDDAAAAAAKAPLSPADTAAYAAFLAELAELEAAMGAAGSGTTYVAGGPGLSPLPGTAWVKPLLTYTISSCYCIRDGGFHHGVDLAAPSGTPIYAVGAGTVVAAGPAQGFGNWVVIDHHDGSFSIYGHMRVLATVVGAQVAPGALIAYVGDEGESSGYHLHFEVRIGSYASSASSTDPVLWLAQRGVTL